MFCSPEVYEKYQPLSCVCLCFRCLGASLALCPEYSLVLEDELGVCGCAVGILDVRSFAKRCQATWLTAMRDKYPLRLHGASGHTATKVRVKAKHTTTLIMQYFKMVQ